MSATDDQTLDRLLASVGRHLDVDAAGADTSIPRRHRRLLTVAAAAIVAAILVVAIAPARRTVAGWLGIGSTEVVYVPGPPLTTAPLPSITSGLTAIDRAEAEQRLGRPLPDTAGTALGAPQAIAAMPEGGVVLEWADGATTLWVHRGDAPPQVLVKKLVGNEQEARFVDDLGDGALAISGEHFLVTPHRTIAAGNVVLWTDGPTELRLESELPVDAMIAIARQVR